MEVVLIKEFLLICACLSNKTSATLSDMSLIMGYLLFIHTHTQTHTCIHTHGFDVNVISILTRITFKIDAVS